MRLTVNGTPRELVSPPMTSLLGVLREELGITSPKAGCQQGGCGACTVLIDGEPRRSCLTPLAAIDGAEVSTVEGLGDPTNLSTVQAAFDQHYAAQCGFCTSGFLMASHALVQSGGGTSREEIVDALSRPRLPVHGLREDHRRGHRRGARRRPHGGVLGRRGAAG